VYVCALTASRDTPVHMITHHPRRWRWVWSKGLTSTPAGPSPPVATSPRASTAGGRDAYGSRPRGTAASRAPRPAPPHPDEWSVNAHPSAIHRTRWCYKRKRRARGSEESKKGQKVVLCPPYLPAAEDPEEEAALPEAHGGHPVLHGRLPRPPRLEQQHRRRVHASRGKPTGRPRRLTARVGKVGDGGKNLICIGQPNRL
jgi:hypothetical protein